MKMQLGSRLNSSGQDFCLYMKNLKGGANMTAFNCYHWENYKKAGGEKTIKIFSDFIEGKNIDAAVNKLVELHKLYCPDGSLSDMFAEEIHDAAQNIHKLLSRENDSENRLNSNTEFSADNFYNILAEEQWDIYKHDEDNIEYSDKDTAAYFYSSIEYNSLLFSFEFYDYCIPYNYRHIYNVLTYICDEFDITLPKLPTKSDFKGRFMHYFEICKTFYAFRVQNNLSVPELWAFLYEYANGVIGHQKWLSSASGEARSVFCCGGSSEDAKHLELIIHESPESAIFWQSNPDAERQDIHVMYLRTPHSAVKYILRAVSDGFIDPLAYYYTCIYLSKPIVTPLLTNKAMQEDPELSKIPLIRANMQGVNGRRLKSSEYQAFVNKFIELGMSKEEIPRLREYSTLDYTTLQNEKDVEEHLVKPFLKRLGYTESDYIQQLVVKVGRSEKAIPDFIVKPIENNGRKICTFIVEAKYSIPTIKQLEKDFKQALSYAKLLDAQALILASLEGIWTASNKDNFTKIADYSWSKLENSDILNAVYGLIGNRRR